MLKRNLQFRVISFSAVPCDVLLLGCVDVNFSSHLTYIKKIFSTVPSVFTEVCCVIKHPKIYKTGKFLAINITEIFLMFFFRETAENRIFFSL